MLTNLQKQDTGDRLFEDREINLSMVTIYSGRFSDLFKQFGIHSITFHNLRHTFATLHSDVGSDIITTKELLGHSDITTTMRYRHLLIKFTQTKSYC